MPSWKKFIRKSRRAKQMARGMARPPSAQPAALAIPVAARREEQVALMRGRIAKRVARGYL